MIGSICSPDMVGDARCTVCSNSGRNVIAPNIEKPTTALAAEEIRKIELRNSDSGTIGSSTRRSISTNTVVSTTAPIPSPTITGEDQGYCVPPQVSISTSAVTAADSTA